MEQLGHDQFFIKVNLRLDLLEPLEELKKLVASRWNR